MFLFFAKLVVLHLKKKLVVLREAACVNKANISISLVVYFFGAAISGGSSKRQIPRVPVGPALGLNLM
jgi:hypothetical protein